MSLVHDADADVGADVGAGAGAGAGVGTGTGTGAGAGAGAGTSKKAQLLLRASPAVCGVAWDCTCAGAGIAGAHARSDGCATAVQLSLYHLFRSYLSVM